MKLRPNDAVTWYTLANNNYMTAWVNEAGDGWAHRPQGWSLTVGEVEGHLTARTGPGPGQHLYKSYDEDSGRPIEMPERVFAAIEEARENVGAVGKVEYAGKLKFDGKLIGDE